MFDVVVSYEPVIGLQSGSRNPLLSPVMLTDIADFFWARGKSGDGKRVKRGTRDAYISQDWGGKGICDL